MTFCEKTMKGFYISVLAEDASTWVLTVLTFCPTGPLVPKSPITPLDPASPLTP